MTLRAATSPPIQHQFLANFIRAKNRDFGTVDDGRCHNPAQRPQRRQRRRRAGQVFRRELVRARRFGQAAISAANSQTDFDCAALTTGTIKPPSVCVAMPRLRSLETARHSLSDLHNAH